MCDNPTDFIHKFSKYLDSAQTFQLFEKDALPCQSFKTSRHCPWPLPALCTTALFTSKEPSDKIPSQRSTPLQSKAPDTVFYNICSTGHKIMRWPWRDHKLIAKTWFLCFSRLHWWKVPRQAVVGKRLIVQEVAISCHPRLYLRLEWCSLVGGSTSRSWGRHLMQRLSWVMTIGWCGDIQQSLVRWEMKLWPSDRFDWPLVSDQ